jgi:hypothetical protein
MNTDTLSSICQVSECYRAVPLSYTTAKRIDKSIHIPLVAAGMNGVYAFIEERDDASYIYNELKKKLKLYDGLFLFIEGKEEAGFLYDPLTHFFLDIPDFETGVDNFYYNHLIPQSDLPFYHFRLLKDYLVEQAVPETLSSEGESKRFIRPVVPNEKLDQIIDVLEDMKNEPYRDGDYEIYPDGSMRVRRLTNSGSFGGFGSTQTHSYPCAEEDGKTTFWVTLLGGWFGLHKFRAHKWGTGILYLLTCGMCGVFWVCDVLALLTGSYSNKVVEYSRGQSGTITRTISKVYARPIKDKRFWLGIPASIFAAILLVSFVYRPTYNLVSTGVGTVMESVAEDQVESNLADYGLNGITLSDDELEAIETMSDDQLEEYLETGNK